MSENRPNLGDFFARGPKGDNLTLKVYTHRETLTFDIHGFRIDTGHLILYRATDADNNSVRLRPHAVFAPGGWVGYEWEDDAPPASMPVGFHQNPNPPS